MLSISNIIRSNELFHMTQQALCWIFHLYVCMKCLLIMESYPPLSVLQSMNTLQPARCKCPHHQVPPAGWSICGNRLHCRSQSARRAGRQCSLCTSGCYIWGWTRCNPGWRDSFQGRFCPPEVLQCWQEALWTTPLEFTNKIFTILLNAVPYSDPSFSFELHSIPHIDCDRMFILPSTSR